MKVQCDKCGSVFKGETPVTIIKGKNVAYADPKCPECGACSIFIRAHVESERGGKWYGV